MGAEVNRTADLGLGARVEGRLAEPKPNAAAGEVFRQEVGRRR